VLAEVVPCGPNRCVVLVWHIVSHCVIIIILAVLNSYVIRGSWYKSESRDFISAILVECFCLFSEQFVVSWFLWTFSFVYSDFGCDNAVDTVAYRIYPNRSFQSLTAIKHRVN